MNVCLWLGHGVPGGQRTGAADLPDASSGSLHVGMEGACAVPAAAGEPWPALGDASAGGSDGAADLRDAYSGSPLVGMQGARAVPAMPGKLWLALGASSTGAHVVMAYCMPVACCWCSHKLHMTWRGVAPACAGTRKTGVGMRTMLQCGGLARLDSTLDVMGLGFGRRAVPLGL